MKDSHRRVVAQNKKARFNYKILETFEAGIMLKGTELKPIRDGRINLADAFAEGLRGELFLMNCNIAEYNKSGVFGHNPLRPRKLLLHRRQVNKLLGALKVGGQTVVPLSIYFNERNYLKVEIAIASGKKLYDKRADIKQREWDREKLSLLKKRNQVD